jgi:hypothetical protein
MKTILIIAVLIGTVASASASADGGSFTDLRIRRVTFDKVENNKLSQVMPPDDYVTVLCLTCRHVHPVSPRNGEVPSGDGE